ncbi:T9SS type A sorting domain-containing protein [Candidatus Fermentibacterales bacterium]|nr:T9SS type A sorting domain-containing protein [Candidatus Fermentibacterales bacterium]
MNARSVVGSVGALGLVAICAGSGYGQPWEHAVHDMGELWNTVWDCLMYGDPWEDYPGCAWPGPTMDSYLWCGDVWSFAYGAVTVHGDSISKWASCSDYGNWEIRCSDGYPLEYLTPGPVAPGQSQFGADDWDITYNPSPYGLMVWNENYTWDSPGYDDFMAMKLVFTHHSEHGNPGVPLDAFVVGVRGDCDVASSDQAECNLDDLVYYDGHAIWCNEPGNEFDYLFFDGIPASSRDFYTYQQNPDASYPDPDDNVYYHYNYPGPDGLVDADVDANGVSDHLTILAKVAGADTVYVLDEESGILMFSGGMPPGHWHHTVGDTTYLVVPRNLSYMWDSDTPGSPEDDSGEWAIDPPCNGFVGWRLLDCWVREQNGSIARFVDVSGCAIPLCHTWWTWEYDPGTDMKKYDYAWSNTPFGITPKSGPEYISGWLGHPCAPEAYEPDYPGPFPFISDSPIEYGFPAFDHRFLLSIGPVRLDDGDSLYVMGGWVVGAGLEGLRRNADLMLDAYWREGVWGGATPVVSGLAPIRPAMRLRMVPSPATAVISVLIELPDPGELRLDVFDCSGRLAISQSCGSLSAGSHEIALDLGDLPSGVYFARATSGAEAASGRFVVLR